MPKANVIRWRDGEGWIVLSGGGDFDSADSGHIEASALAKIQAGDPVAYIWAAGDIERADEHLTALYDLGAPTGYLVDILTEDDDSLRNQLKEAGLIVLGDGPNLKALRSALPGVALDTIAAAHDEGAVILGIGAGAVVLGAVAGDKNGIGWVENALITPAYENASVSLSMRQTLEQQPDLYGIGISTGSALMLGPNGEVEALGNKQVTIALGRTLTK
jgi:hypothetical protein